MKKILFLIFILSCTCYSQDTETTYYLIRHAEKERTDITNKDPKLNTKGLKRALNWSLVFKDIQFDAIYSTHYKRTIATASPTARSKTLKLNYYNPRELYDDAFKIATKNKTVLIVGHSNTSPAFANKIIGTHTYDGMEHLNNGNLYIIRIQNNKTTSQLLHIN